MGTVFARPPNYIVNRETGFDHSGKMGTRRNGIVYIAGTAREKLGARVVKRMPMRETRSRDVRAMDGELSSARFQRYAICPDSADGWQFDCAQ